VHYVKICARRTIEKDIYIDMKISENILRKIIKEELENVLKLVSDFADLNKFKKQKSYHDEEDCDNEFSTDVEDFHSGIGNGKRKHPTDYLKGGANEKSTSDNIMLGGSTKGEFDDGEGADIIIRWQKLAESKRR
jgi:hypothetical protein